VYIVVGRNPTLGNEYGKSGDEGVILGIFGTSREAERVAGRHSDVAIVHVKEPLTYKFKDGGKRIDMHGWIRSIKR